MSRQALQLWSMVGAGVVAFVWLAWELVRVAGVVTAQAGWRGTLVDGVVLHKVGELLIAAPLFALFVMAAARRGDQARAWAARLWPLLVAGGVLNVAAYFALDARPSFDLFFRVWCWVLAVIGGAGWWTTRAVVGLADLRTRRR